MKSKRTRKKEKRKGEREKGERERERETNKQREMFGGLLVAGFFVSGSSSRGVSGCVWGRVGFVVGESVGVWAGGWWFCTTFVQF